MMAEELDLNWEELLQNKDIEESWTLFANTVRAAVEKHIPRVKAKKKEKLPWRNYKQAK